jgi:hypothetical protein
LLYPFEGIALPDVVLVQEVATKDPALRRVPGKELPVETEGKDKKS